MLKGFVGTVQRALINQRKCYASSSAVLARAYSTRPAADNRRLEIDTMSQEANRKINSVFAPPSVLANPMNVPVKLLMGPGPTNVSPRVMQASSNQMLGHMHAETFQIMDEIKAGLRYVFQTSNPWTLVVSGPGHLGMEAVLVNLLEPGDKVLIGINGLWGKRAVDLANKLGASPIPLEQETGKSISLDEIEQGLSKHKPKVLFLIHSESSSGVMQPLVGVGDLCRKHDCLFVVDTVASLGGVPFFMDDWNVDAVYTGSQKVIGAPPGLSPISFGPRAVEVIKTRKTLIKSYLLDMNELTIQWQCGDPSIPRIYHHTPPVNLFYALREALAELTEEGLENVWKRHAQAAARLHAGIHSLGLKLFVQDESDRLPTVTTILVPEGIDWKRVVQFLMEKHLIEIAGGLGPTVGKVFRIGLLGCNATPEKVDRVLQALKEGLEFAKLQGHL
ncbi:Serine--pyruvate aminotransferase, mitochondrial [Orchesella cincta]|uniref:alanine--glyoxylate transaminase n=1 Tax=Orchesella cincta TaxID=48709 RepID=A0A1D2NLR1_ORCCI|nr:Serine--pyruvate aminotransferase, mitochondrial [Orchesella cincta]